MSSQTDTLTDVEFYSIMPTEVFGDLPLVYGKYQGIVEKGREIISPPSYGILEPVIPLNRRCLHSTRAHFLV